VCSSDLYLLKYWQTEKIMLFLQPVNQPLTKDVNVA